MQALIEPRQVFAFFTPMPIYLWQTVGLIGPLLLAYGCLNLIILVKIYLYASCITFYYLKSIGYNKEEIDSAKFSIRGNTIYITTYDADYRILLINMRVVPIWDVPFDIIMHLAGNHYISWFATYIVVYDDRYEKIRIRG